MNIVKPPANGTDSLFVTTGKIKYIPNANFVGKDSFDYSITDILGLKDTARIYITIQNTSGVSIINDKDYLIYPNPVKNVLYIETTVSAKNKKYSIHNMDGRLLTEGIIVKIKEEVPLTEVAKGILTISIVEENGKIIKQKFIKE